MINVTVYKLLRPFFLLLGFFSLFKGISIALFKTSIFEYFDEILFLLSILVLLPPIFLKTKIKIIHLLVLVFVLYSIFVSLIFGVSGGFFSIVLQTLISVKFLIVLLALIELFKGEYENLKRFYLFVIAMAFLGLLVHLVLGEAYNTFTDISTYARPNIRYVGFFTHPNHLAYVLVTYIAYILNIKYSKGDKLTLRDWIHIAASAIVIILADSRTAIIAALFLILYFYIETIKRNFKLIITVFSFCVIAVIYILNFTDFIQTLLLNFKDTLDLKSHYIRGNMIYLSGTIFIDYFPIGTGAATFGSLLSDNTVYEIYGQADRYYFKNEKGIYDSNIASIIGEYGLFGILFFILLFRYLIRFLKQQSTNKSYILPFIFIFLIYSISNPMLTNNLYTLLSGLLLVLFTQQNISNRTA